MKVHHIPFQETGYFSKLICDYLDQKESLDNFYSNYPTIEGFKDQIDQKSGFSQQHRAVLVAALNSQYESIDKSELTTEHINLLEDGQTYTITTGHQLNIFTGPMYFLYKIVSVINLCKQLKEAYPQQNFVPVYWMATEDHDFEEINYFNFNGSKISWDRESSGGVGRLKTDGFDALTEEFSSKIGNSNNAKYLKELFSKAYEQHDNLTAATRYLVNELFKEQGLVIVDGDDRSLKTVFSAVVKDELIHSTSYKNVIETSEQLGNSYKIQVNPREINLFYLKDGLRERIVHDNDGYKVNGTGISFTKEEILAEVDCCPERFSPNVIMRPVYQETILPNICYIGGGGEIAYWFQLRHYFEAIQKPFPILLLRNSALLASAKQLEKLEKLNVSLTEIFSKQGNLINKKVKEVSEMNIDFSNQKLFLQQQFLALKELAKQTDHSFIGAVNAQEKKQLNGLDNLEKRLLKAQKRKLTDEVNRVKLIQDALFPKQSLEERTRNFSEFYLDLGADLIPMLLAALDPLKLEFSVIEYEV